MTLILAEDLRRRRMAASVTSSAALGIAQSSLRAESRKGENVRITGIGFCGILNRSWILNRACCTGTRKGGPGGRTIMQPNQEPFYYFHPCFSFSQSASVTWVSPCSPQRSDQEHLTLHFASSRARQPRSAESDEQIIVESIDTFQVKKRCVLMTAFTKTFPQRSRTTS
ncbi:hypothetical protein E2C01_041039 [Portunus trituberculatus]|uniref:Uncharacterized protein n=1 Tax=Portunus trituberculatus TaxID=210409 RepID=A0A5B7FPL3_PORTR|nr:hypothetical protein [Portunus trituberculatus]